MTSGIAADGLLGNYSTVSKPIAVSGSGKATANDPRAVKKLAGEFEALFIGMMLKSMRGTTGSDKLTGGGHGEEVYSSLLDQEYAKAIAQHGGIGIADMIERQLGASEGNGIGTHEKTAKNGVTHENR